MAPTMSSTTAYRPQIEKMTRKELEDGYCRYYNENQTLKKDLNESQLLLKR
jgi:hypothetical protein